MGPLWSFPVEWWYYGGWAQATSQIDNQPAPKFTLFLQTVRLSKNVAFIYGIGTTLNSKQPMLINQSFASGFHCEKSQGQQGLIIPPTKHDQWYCEARTLTMQMTCQLTSGMHTRACSSFI